MGTTTDPTTTSSTSTTADTEATTGIEDCPARIDLRFDPLTVSDGVDDLVFPVKFGPNDIEFDYDAAQLDGLDVRFLDVEGNPVPHEIDVFRPAGDSVFWVRMPRVDGDSDRLIVCYGTGEDAVSPEPVWDAGFVAVWHLDGDSDLGEDQVDRSGNGNDGAANGVGAEGIAVVDSPLGYGLTFATTGEYIVVLPANIPLTDQLTVELIVRSTNLTDGDFVAPLTSPSFDGRLRTQANDSPNVQVIFEQGSSTVYALQTAAENQWYYITGVYNGPGESLTTCLNGDACDSSTITGGPNIMPLAAANEIRLGQFDGTIDEVRVSNVARTPEWISAAQRGLEGLLVSPL